MLLKEVLFVALTGLLIGFSKAGVAGVMTLLGPLLALVFQAKFATGVPLPLLISGDLFVLWRFGRRWEWRVIAPMLPGAALGIAIGGLLLHGLTNHLRLFNQVIGVLALAFSALQLGLDARRARRLRRGEEQAHQPATPLVGAAAGSVTGVLSTIANQGGLVTNLYLVSQQLAKERFVATQAVLYGCINTTKLIPFAFNGLITPHTLTLDLYGLPFVIVGGFLGARVLRVMNDETFIKVILWMTILTGLKLVCWP